MIYLDRKDIPGELERGEFPCLPLFVFIFLHMKANFETNAQVKGAWFNLLFLICLLSVNTYRHLGTESSWFGLRKSGKKTKKQKKTK